MTAPTRLRTHLRTRQCWISEPHPPHRPLRGVNRDLCLGVRETSRLPAWMTTTDVSIYLDCDPRAVPPWAVRNRVRVETAANGGRLYFRDDVEMTAARGAR